jgi:CHAD domain-containing protein
MKIQTEIDIEEILALRLALKSLESLLKIVDPNKDKWQYEYEQKHLTDAGTALNSIVKRS